MSKFYCDADDIQMPIYAEAQKCLMHPKLQQQGCVDFQTDWGDVLLKHKHSNNWSGVRMSEQASKVTVTAARQERYPVEGTLRHKI